MVCTKWLQDHPKSLFGILLQVAVSRFRAPCFLRTHGVCKTIKRQRRNTSYLVCFLSDLYIVIFFCYITLLQSCCFFVFKTNTSLVWLAKLYFVMVMVLVFYWMKNLLTLHSCRQENLLALISIALICEFHSLNYKKKIYYQGFKRV